MGSGVSLQIDLHKQRGQNESTPVRAGNVLQGKVILELTRPMWLEQSAQKQYHACAETATNAVDLSLLTLRIYGKEKVHMKLNSARKRAKMNGHVQALSASSTYPYPVTAERQFFEVKLPLREFPPYAFDEKRNCIIPGLYKFPFQVQLPAVLPASMSYNPYTRLPHATSKSFTGKHGFRIQYKMYVELHSVSKKGLRSEPQHLWVTSAPKAAIQNDPVPSMVLPLPHELNGGFWSQGTLLTAASLEDTIVSRSDDHMNLHLACRNNSRADIQRVQLYLVETLRWGTVASTGDAAGSVLQEESNLVLFALNDIQLPTLAKDRMTIIQSVAQSVFGTKNRAEREFLKSIHQDLKSDQSKLSITLPLASLARDSYSGQLLQVSHHIEIHFLTSGMQKSNNPTIMIPIRMVNGDRHSIEATGSFCNSIAESEEEQHAIALDALEDPTSKVDSFGEENIEIQTKPATEQQQNVIPSAPAKGIQTTVAGNDVIVLGGDTALFYAHNKHGASITSLADLIPLAPPSADKMGTSTPTLQGLFSEMRSSVDAYNLILRKVQSPEWVRLFENLTAYEFGQVIAHISDPFDQPRVAVVVGQHVNRRINMDNKKINGMGLTCEYLAFALRNTVKIHRCTTAQGLLPMCTDAANNYQLVINELSEWDLTCVEKELETAMSETKMRQRNPPTISLPEVKNKKPSKHQPLKEAIPC